MGCLSTKPQAGSQSSCTGDADVTGLEASRRSSWITQGACFREGTHSPLPMLWLHNCPGRIGTVLGHRRPCHTHFLGPPDTPTTLAWKTQPQETNQTQHSNRDPSTLAQAALHYKRTHGPHSSRILPQDERSRGPCSLGPNSLLSLQHPEQCSPQLGPAAPALPAVHSQPSSDPCELPANPREPANTDSDVPVIPAPTPSSLLGPKASQSALQTQDPTTPQATAGTTGLACASGSC